MVYTDWVLNSTQSVCIYTPPRDREHTPEAAAAFRTVRSECFELSGLGLVTLRLLTIPLPIRVSRPPTRAYSWAPFELSSVWLCDICVVMCLWYVCLYIDL